MLSKVSRSSSTGAKLDCQLLFLVHTCLDLELFCLIHSEIGCAGIAPPCRPLLARPVFRICLHDSTNGATPKTLVYQADFTFPGIPLVPCIPFFTLELSLERLKNPEEAFAKVYKGEYSLRELGC